MSTDFSIRPVGAPVPTSLPPAANNAALGGVQTQLPASQTVTASEAGGGVRNDPQASTDAMSHQAFFDRAAESLVLQIVNSQTDQVVDQFPDDAALRRRAYFHSLDLAKDSSSRPLVTDVKA